LELRTGLRKHSVLGEYGAEAIQQALHSETSANAPSRATINRVLARHGLQDAPRRSRRPAPPRGWYLPAVAGGQSELDSFDLIEDLKIAGGPLTSILTGTSLHGGLVDAWPLSEATAKLILQRLIERWQREGLPQYAQFDNGTQFQGAHQWPDSIGRVSRLCLALQVIPVFAPPREPGFQNAIEGFNALWQTKVWQRFSSWIWRSCRPFLRSTALAIVPATYSGVIALRGADPIPRGLSSISMQSLAAP
jgi:hypothetical protein